VVEEKVIVVAPPVALELIDSARPTLLAHRHLEPLRVLRRLKPPGIDPQRGRRSGYVAYVSEARPED
jgi:hypothetical protein